MSEIERRAALELRAAGRRLEGYAAVFDQETRIADFTETVAHGAFSRSLSDAGDIVALVDHDPSRLLARTKAGTLQLSEDSRGLHFRTSELPSTSYANDALALVQSGDIGGASFGFRVRPGGERWQESRRTLTSVDLFDISVVTAFPAYDGTTVNARARQALTPQLSRARLWMQTVRYGI